MKRLALLASLLLASTAVAQGTPDRRFSGRDLFDLQQASDPQISPDGSRVVYVRQGGDIMTDRYRGSLWLVDARTAQQTPLVASGGSARWSPDGTRIAYVAAEGGTPQLFVRWLASGATAKITGLPDSPGSIAWSPDGRWIAYTMTVPGDGQRLGSAPPKPEGANWAPPLEVIDRVNYRNDGGGYVKPGYDHIFVVSADGGAPRQLTFGNYDDGGPISWARDGRSIVFSANRDKDAERSFNSELYRVEVASGALTALTARNGPDAAPIVSPDGSRVAWIGYDDDRRSNQNFQLYVGDANAANPRSLTAPLDRSIDDVAWAGDSRSLYVSYDDRGEKKVARVGLDGRSTPVASGLAGGGLDRPYTGGSFTVSRGGTLAYTGGDALNPADLYIGGRRVTRLNDNLWAAKSLGQVRKLPVTAKDGRTIDAWLVTPPGYQAGTRVPLILEIHGGPHSAYGPAFSTDNQLYASAGYAVLYTNPRGSTSYGEAFANLIDKNYPAEDYDDLMSSVDAAVAAGVADPDNLFVTGGSGGGVLTAWIVGKTNRFKAAVTQKPVINWISEALTMDGTAFTSTYWFRKRPWEEPMEYWRRSPLSLVGNVETPTAVVVGSNDYRTPVSESEQYYAALQIRGVPTMLVKVPEASHGGIAARPSQAAAKASAVIAWFDRYRGKPKWTRAAAQ
jgi:dipeptidyl aminopeptidase/acylaminoacyl peptidase